jgi:RNA polymerase sigma factor (sigma-70 family)
MSNVIPLYSERGASTPPSDNALLAATACGDMAAFGELFRRHHANVHAFLSRLSGTDDSELDDLVQNTFLEVRKSAERFQGRSNFRSWVFGVAANVAKHHVRSSVRRRTAFRALAVEIGTRLNPGEACEHVERKVMMAELMAAVEGLSYKLRVVVIMCDVEGIPGAEAAKSLGIREGTLWRRLHDARKKLSAELERRASK